MTELSFIDTDFVPAYQQLAVEGGTLAWWEAGRGDRTIIWVHGLPLDSRSWEAQRRHFEPLCRNIFIDLRGYGQSTKLPTGTPDVTALYCSDLTALFDALALDGAALVGFASAGHVALRFAALNTNRISKLVTINGSPKFRCSEDWPWGFSDAGIAHFTDRLASGDIAGITEAVLDPDLAFNDLPRPQAERLAAWFRPMSLNAGAATLLGFFDGISTDDDRHLLPGITMPTLLICGTGGKEVPSAVGLYLRTHLPKSNLVELAGVDHFCFASRPAIINALIDDFIQAKS